MIKKPFSALLLAIAFFLAACASNKTEKAYYVYVTDTKKVRLLPTFLMEQTVELLQVFSGSYKAKSMNMLAYTECNKDIVSIKLLNDFGIEIATVVYSGDDLVFNSKFIADNFKSEYIVMDLQNVFYENASLAALYKASGLLFLTEKTGDMEIRTIMDNDMVIEKIIKSDKAIIIENYLRDYKYQLTEVTDE